MSRIFAFICLLVIVSSCGKDDEPQVESPVISIAPSSVLFNDTDSIDVSLRLISGESTTWQLSSIPVWLKADTNSGTISKDEIVNINLTADTDGYPTGKLSGVIEVIWGTNESRSINVTVCINPKPKLTITETDVTLTEFNGYSANIRLINSGDGVISFNAVPQSNDLFVSTSGTETIDPGQEYYLYVNYNIFPNQQAGIIETSIIIQSNDSSGDQVINVTIDIPASSSLFLDFFDTSFGLNKDVIRINLTNDGNSATEWSFNHQSFDKNIIPNPSSGNLSPGETIQVEFTLDRTGLDNGYYTEDFELVSNEGPVDFLVLDYQVYTEEKYLLDGTAIDAEYSRSRNVMYVIQEFPNLVVAFDSATETVDNLNMGFTPLEISLSPSESYAVVRGFSNFSVIDCASFNVINTVPTTIGIDAITIDDLGNTYVFSTNGLTTYDLSGNENNTGLAGGKTLSKARLHPTNNSIFAVSNASNELLVFDITDIGNISETSQFLNFDPHSDFWFSDLGDKLITQTADIYDINNNQVSYIKHIDISDEFLDVFYSSTFNIFSGVIAFIDDYDPNNIYPEGGFKFRASDCSQQQPIDDITFVVNNFGDFYIEPGVARYVGIDESSSSYIVVSSTYDIQAGPWAISKIAIQ